MTGVTSGFYIWYGNQSCHPRCRILVWDTCVWVGGMAMTDAGTFIYECGLVPDSGHCHHRYVGSMPIGVIGKVLTHS